jgi:hypothetical protein
MKDSFNVPNVPLVQGILGEGEESIYRLSVIYSYSKARVGLG